MFRAVKSGVRFQHLAQEPAPALLRGPLSPSSPELDTGGPAGGSGGRPSSWLGRNPVRGPGVLAGVGPWEAHDAARAEAGGRRELVGGALDPHPLPSPGWRGSLERTSMRLQEELLGVPEGVQPMGDATGQVGRSEIAPVLHLCGKPRWYAHAARARPCSAVTCTRWISTLPQH